MCYFCTITNILWLQTIEIKHISHIKRPLSLPLNHKADLTAPLANVMRLDALWVISRRSPISANIAVCSPTMSPARTVAKPMVPGTRSPVWPFTTVDRAIFQIFIKGVGDRLSHCQCGRLTGASTYVYDVLHNSISV